MRYRQLGNVYCHVTQYSFPTDSDVSEKPVSIFTLKMEAADPSQTIGATYLQKRQAIHPEIWQSLRSAPLDLPIPNCFAVPLTELRFPNLKTRASGRMKILALKGKSKTWSAKNVKTGGGKGYYTSKDVYFIFQMVVVASIRGSTFLRNVGVKLRTYRVPKFWGLSPQQHTSWNAENLHLLYPATRASLTSRNILISFSYQRQKNTRDLNYRNGRNCKWQPSVLSVISFVMATVVLATLCLSRGARQPVDRQSRPVRLFVLFIRVHNRWK